MQIGPVTVETQPIAPSLYMRLSRIDSDPTPRTFALLGFAIKDCPIPAPQALTATSVEAFGDAVLDHYVGLGATFADLTVATAEATRDVVGRLGFTKAEVKKDADFSEATGDGSAPG